MNPSSEIRCRVRINHILYPRTAFTPGDFAILACTVVKVLDGEPYDNNITIKGKVFSADIGGTYLLDATLVKDGKYGYGYKIDSFQQDCDMNNPAERLEFLKTFVTNKQYEALTWTFDDPLTYIENGDITTLTKANGIGESTAKHIVKKYQENRKYAKAYSRLSRYGMTTEAITSLLHRYTDADKLLAMLDEDPYMLIGEVRGIGWTRADEIAKKMGIADNDPRRLQAYVGHFLNCRADDGHTWSTPDELWDAFSYDLQIDDPQFLRDAMYALHEKDKLWWSEDRSKIALVSLRNLEQQIAHELHRIASGALIKPKDAGSEIAMIEQRQGWSFTDEQMEAVNNVINSNVVIITGYAGTGKSSVVSAALKLLDGHSFAQCALSGRAAARLTEVTGQEGKTIHRLLGYQGYFTRNETNPLNEEIIILDEVSMVGAELFLSLIKAIPTGSKLIMLGDDGQLESIGLCNIFKDMLDCGVIPVNRLTKIHRQAAKSAIITESIKVRNGQQLCEDKWIGQEVRGELQDLTLHVSSESMLTYSYILDHYKELINSGVSKHHIQIVVPMKNRGDACTSKLNNAVQKIVNSENANVAVKVGKDNNAYELRLDDRVICVKNMYKATHPDLVENEYGELVNEECPVYNGDRGVITKMGYGFIIVRFDLWGDIIIYEKDYSAIELGYALSCHKLQGSEAEYVIIGFDMSSRVLLTKEWLYTAITRAKKQCIISAYDKALRFCIETSNIPLKRTFLKELLIETFSQPYHGQDISEVI